MSLLSEEELKELYTLAYARQAITTDIKKITKQQKDIKKSRAYRIGTKIKWLLPFLEYMHSLLHLRKIMKESKQLRSIVEQTDLLLSKDQTIQQIIDNRHLTETKVLKEINKYLDDEGLLLDYLDRYLTEAKNQHINQVQLTKILNRQIKQYNYPELNQGLIEKMGQTFYHRGLPEHVLRLAKEYQLPLNQSLSFQQKLQAAYQQSYSDSAHPINVLDHKWHAYQFVDKLNIEYPEYSKSTFSLSDLPFITGIAVKPLDGGGSRGVYLVHAEDHIVNLKQQQTLKSWEELKQSMEADLLSGAVNTDEWYYETLIGNDDEGFELIDYKFYSFYGHTPLLLEIKRHPELKYCWRDIETGSVIQTGKYDDQLFEGRGISEDMLDQVNQLSKQLPLPFMRIDFIKDKDNYLFGEFTPFPGNYDEFNNEIDHWLGSCYLEAEKRLYNDLLNGKTFQYYKEIITSLGD